MAIKLIREEAKELGVVTARVEFTIDDNISWPDLIEYVTDFMKGCGYQLPKGQLTFIDKDEIVVKKVEHVLYGKGTK